MVFAHVYSIAMVSSVTTALGEPTRLCINVAHEVYFMWILIMRCVWLGWRCHEFLVLRFMVQLIIALIHVPATGIFNF